MVFGQWDMGTMQHMISGDGLPWNDPLARLDSSSFYIACIAYFRCCLFRVTLKTADCLKLRRPRPWPRRKRRKLPLKRRNPRQPKQKRGSTSLPLCQSTTQQVVPNRLMIPSRQQHGYESCLGIYWQNPT